MTVFTYWRVLAALRLQILHIWLPFKLHGCNYETAKSDYCQYLLLVFEREISSIFQYIQLFLSRYLLFCVLVLQRVGLSINVCDDEIYFFKKPIIPRKVSHCRIIRFKYLVVLLVVFGHLRNETVETDWLVRDVLNVRNILRIFYSLILQLLGWCSNKHHHYRRLLTV